MKERLTELVKENESLQLEIAKLKQTEQLAQRQTQTLCRVLSGLAMELTHLAEKVKQEVQQSTVVEERDRIAQELHNSLGHLQEVPILNNTYPFNHALDMANAEPSTTQGYLLQDIPWEESTEKIRLIHQDYTQLKLGIQEKMVANVLATEPKSLEKPPLGLLELTPKEREVLRMVTSGANNKEIARALCLSEGTVRNYISRILRQLNVRDRTQAPLVANTFLG